MKKLLFIIAGLLFIVACTNETVIYTESCSLKDRHLCDSRAFIRVQNVDANDLINEIDPIILDVRTVEEYRQGHLPNSMLIPDYELSTRISELEEYKDQPIFVYCRTNNRAAVAARILKSNGFEEVYILDTGFDSMR